MGLPLRGPDGFYHPSNETEIIELINYARARRITIRVRGSGHSVPEAICTDKFPYAAIEDYVPEITDNNYPANLETIEVDNGQLDLMLDKMNKLTWSDDGTLVTAQAGCHLGYDPYDPTQTSTYFNSLFYQMEQRNLAVPDMGGITHQTVGGFLSTGSSGGSTTYSLETAIYAIRFIDGLGNVNVCSRQENPDMFAAVAVSMGLLGIITEVTFQPIPRFDIIGEENIRPISEYSSWINFFGPTKGSVLGIEDYFRSTEYSRMLWWPQAKVNKMTVWQARRMKPADYTSERVQQVGGKTVLKAKPYQEMTWVFGTPTTFEALADLFYTGLATWPVWLFSLIKTSWLRQFVQGAVEAFWNRGLLAMILNAFISTDKRASDGTWQPQHFWDTWWRGLPMDNQMDDRQMPVVFTELWIPLEKAADVMTALKNFYDKGGLPATSTFSCEVYATKASEYWLSPAYGTDVIRIDVFVYGKNPGVPSQYYQQFWDLLKPFGFRAHWGKWMPPATTADRQEWLQYIQQSHPRWNDFMAMREKLDPSQIFVTNYWRWHMGIEGGPTPTPPSPVQPLPPNGPNGALVYGWSQHRSAPWYVYAALALIGVVITYPIEYVSSNVLGIFAFSSKNLELLIIVVLGLCSGLTAGFLRWWGPLGGMVVTFAAIAAANLVNIFVGFSGWEWTSFGPIPGWLVGTLFETMCAIVIPGLVWMVGKRLFASYWPR
jgi:FAD/FMN-containing dehydrogenase